MIRGESMSKESILKIIHSRYSSLTSVEKIIADFFITEPRISDFSSKRLKEELYVSEASLSRFAKKCGFNGYREFIYRYKDTTADISYIEGLNQTLYIYQKLLNDIAQHIDEKQLLRVCDMIKHCRSITIFSMGSSKLAALQMKSKFTRLGVFIDVVNETDEIKMQSVLQTKQRLIIGISLSGKKEILTSLVRSKKHGATTILMTAKKIDSKQLQNYDEIIQVPSVKGLDTGHVISPQFPILVLIDICYYYYTRTNKIQYDSLQKKTVDILQEKY